MKTRIAVCVMVAVLMPFSQAQDEKRASAQAKDPETLTVCSLLANTRSYVGQTVMVKATYVENFEFSALTDASCQPRPEVPSAAVAI